MNTKKGVRIEISKRCEAILKRVVAPPYKFLLKSRDFYAKSLSDCAPNAYLGSYSGVGFLMGSLSPLDQLFSPCASRSFTMESPRMDDNEFRNLLVGITSNTNTGKKKSVVIGQTDGRSNRLGISPVGGVTVVGMSPGTTAFRISRIDEDKPVEDFEEDADEVVLPKMKARRSSSTRRLFESLIPPSSPT